MFAGKRFNIEGKIQYSIIFKGKNHQITGFDNNNILYLLGISYQNTLFFLSS